MPQLTLVDLAKRMANNNMLAIAEVLAEENEIIKDAANVEANGTTIHTFNQRKSEPTGGWRAIGEGTAVEKSVVVQVEEPMGMLEAWSEIDAKLVSLAPDKGKFRSDEDLAFVSGLGKTAAKSLIYGNPGGGSDAILNSSKGILGLANRYNALSHASVHGAGGSSHRTSIWIIQWGDTKVSLLYPRGAKIGLQYEDKGIQTVLDASSNPYDAYRTKFTWDLGLQIQNDKNIQRICNIDAEVAFASHTNKVDDLIIMALNKMPGRGAGAMIYMNSDLMTQFDINAKDKTNVNYGTTNVWGEDVTSFKGRPLRLEDRITVGESAVT